MPGLELLDRAEACLEVADDRAIAVLEPAHEVGGVDAAAHAARVDDLQARGDDEPHAVRGVGAEALHDALERRLVLGVARGDGLARGDRELRLLGTDAERDAEHRVEVRVERQHGVAHPRERAGDGAGHRRLADAAFSGDRDLHLSSMSRPYT